MHTIQNVFCTIRGKCLCLGLSRPADPSSSNLLSESSALHLLLSDGNLQGKTEVFLRKPGNAALHACQIGFASEEGAVHGVFGHCSQEALSLLLLPTRPPASQMFRKVDVTGSLITNKVAVTVYENPVPLAAQL